MTLRTALLALGLILSATPSFAATFEVGMYNRNASGPMTYDPPYLRVSPGDTVKFLASQPSHNAVTIEGGIPEGAEGFKGKINEEIEVTLTVPGHYFIKCSPHFGMGMVMLIEVVEEGANPQRPALPEGMPKEAVERFELILSEAYS